MSKKVLTNVSVVKPYGVTPISDDFEVKMQFYKIMELILSPIRTMGMSLQANVNTRITDVTRLTSQLERDVRYYIELAQTRAKDSGVFTPGEVADIVVEAVRKALSGE